MQEFRRSTTQEPMVALRSMAFEDADVIAGWAANKEFCRTAGWTLGLSFEEHREFQTRLICSPRQT